MIRTACIFVLLVFTTSYIFPDYEPSRDEVARVVSPSGKVDAVLIETNGGATTSFGYDVFLVPSGGNNFDDGTKVAHFYSAGRNKSAYGVNLVWRGKQLTVEYLDAKIEKLLQNTATVAGETVKVSLRSGVNDPNAPAGGMLYNLKERK
jgi:hypothetical protein